MDAATSPEEFSRGQVFAQTLTLPVLTRAWQLLLKGLQDLKDSPRPLASADMVLVRLAHAADLPTPDDLLRRLASGEASAAAAPRAISAAGPAMATTDGGPPARPVRAAVGGSDFSAPRALAAAVPVAPASPSHAVGLATFADVVALAGTYRDIQLRTALERDVRLVRFDRGSIEFSLVDGAPSQIAQTLQRRLLEWTGERWMITVAREGGAPSLHEQAQAREEETLVGVRALPLVRSVFEHFPGAEIVAIRKPEAEAAPTSVAPIAPPPADASEDIGYTDDFDEDNDDL
jgi:DNA polymerase-3 subunit gamma/tau